MPGKQKRPEGPKHDASYKNFFTHARTVADTIPRDESLFDDATEPAAGVYCASPIVTYLDLWVGDDRDREAAEHLASKCFPWL